jgi:hypothetical protein
MDSHLQGCLRNMREQGSSIASLSTGAEASSLDPTLSILRKWLGPGKGSHRTGGEAEKRKTDISMHFRDLLGTWLHFWELYKMSPTMSIWLRNRRLTHISAALILSSWGSPPRGILYCYFWLYLCKGQVNSGQKTEETWEEDTQKKVSTWEKMFNIISH